MLCVTLSTISKMLYGFYYLVPVRSLGNFEDVNYVVSKGRRYLEEPLHSIYNLSFDQRKEFVLGLYIMASLSFEEKVGLVTNRLKDTEDYLKKMFEVKYDIYCENEILRYLLTRSFKREEEITLRGTQSLLKLVQLIKNPPKEIKLTDKEQGIIKNYCERSIDYQSLLYSTVIGNIPIIELIVGSMSEIYSTTEDPEELIEFLEKVKRKVENEYNERMCREVDKMLDDDFKTVNKEYEDDIQNDRFIKTSSRIEALTQSILKEKYGDRFVGMALRGLFNNDNACSIM